VLGASASNNSKLIVPLSVSIIARVMIFPCFLK
jgi:hypothetical protein